MATISAIDSINDLLNNHVNLSNFNGNVIKGGGKPVNLSKNRVNILKLILILIKLLKTDYKKKVRMANNAIENKFAEFVPEESFAIDDTAAYIVYPQLSNRKIAGEYKWELWEANLVDGKLKNAHKIIIKDFKL